MVFDPGYQQGIIPLWFGEESPDQSVRRSAALPGWSVNSFPVGTRQSTLSSILDTWWTAPDPLPARRKMRGGIPWRYLSESLSSSLDLTHAVTVVWPETLTSDLALYHTYSDMQDTEAASSAAFIDVGVATMVMHEADASSLGLTHSIIDWVVHGGAGSAAVSDCDSTYLVHANLSLKKDVVFTYGVNTVTLRAPELGNSTLLDVGTIIRKTRGGEYDVFKPSAWPTVELLRMSFRALSDAIKTDLVTFLSISAGYQIQFRDHENVTWNGVITTPVADVVKAIGLCSSEIELEFRGVRM